MSCCVFLISKMLIVLPTTTTHIYMYSKSFIIHYNIFHYATSRKVAGSIPDGVIGIFHWRNPSGRTMALGLTQPLTEISTRNLSWRGGGIGDRCLRADNITTLICRLSWNLGASNSWNPQGLSRPVIGLFYLFTHVSAAQISHHQLGALYTKEYQGTEASFRCERALFPFLYLFKMPLPQYIPLCIRHLPDERWSGQPQYFVVYNKKLIY
jgi:hypothetical protein